SRSRRRLRDRPRSVHGHRRRGTTVRRWRDGLAKVGGADDRRSGRRRRLRVRRATLLGRQQLVVVEAVLRTESEEADATCPALRAETCFAGHRAAWDRWLARPMVIDSDRPSYPGRQDYGPREEPLVARLVARRPESSAVVNRDERLLAAHFQLLDRPRIAVGIAEAEERPAVIRRELHDLADIDAAIDELLARRSRVRHDQLEPPDRAWRHLALGRQVPEHDRAA